MSPRQLISGCAVMMLAVTAPAAESQTTSSPAARRPLSAILGSAGVLADSVTQEIVQRLDFANYKRLIRGLADFGDRRHGSAGNLQAVEYIETMLQEWGYETVRHEYDPPYGVQVYATRIGSSTPGEMYILGAHMDGLGRGEAVNDNASGTALVMEIARVLSSPDIQLGPSVRFILWNGEEQGLVGARAYVAQRAELQGIQDPEASGNYPEPRWLGMIQHDKVLFDHGLPAGERQIDNADVDIEYQLISTQSAASAQLALALLDANRLYATEYPATVSNAMSNTDSNAFMNSVAAVSVRENRRRYEIGSGSDPHWHRPSDVYATYSDEDFQLGFNAMQTTLAAVLHLSNVRVVAP